MYTLSIFLHSFDNIQDIVRDQRAARPNFKSSELYIYGRTFSCANIISFFMILYKIKDASFVVHYFQNRQKRTLW